jgi:nucleoside-diphosphate-sugar epimerase
MNVLLIGGTGLISQGILSHLHARKARVTMFNRGQRENRVAGDVATMTGDRNDFESFERAHKDARYDVVMDMICYTPQQAESAVRAFGGKCGQFMFCSTVCTYGIKSPTNVLVDETFPQEPISEYGRNKVLCEQIFMRAHEAKKFQLTIVRPSSTYGPGGRVIDNLEFDPVAWDRIEKGLPIVCSGDGLGLWVSTHRNDCGKFFAFGAMNPKTFGQSYNATRDEHLTWREHLRQIAQALGKPAKLIFMPAGWIVAKDPKRFGLLREITQYHGAYSSEKAKRDVPEYRCEIGLVEGAKQTLEDVRQRGAWRSCEGDSLYQSMVDEALSLGVTPVET